MKRTLYTTLLIFVVHALSYATPPGKRALDGYWHSHGNYDNIKIDQKRNHLRVRNLFQYGWVRYEELSDGFFKDYHGNIIRVYNRSELVAKQKIRRRFSRDRYSRPIAFHRNKLNSCALKRHPRNNDRDFYDYGIYDSFDGSCSSDNNYSYLSDGYGHEGRLNRSRNDRSRNSDYRSTNTKRGFNIDDVLGTWVSENNVKVRVQKSGHGIKAKVIGKDTWDVYIKDGRNQFTNNKGSSYIFKEGELIWRSRNGNTKTFVKR